MCPCLIICTAVLPKNPKLITIAALEIQSQEEDRNPFGNDFFRTRLGTYCSLLQLSNVTKDVGIFFFFSFEPKS